MLLASLCHQPRTLPIHHHLTPVLLRYSRGIVNGFAAAPAISWSCGSQHSIILLPDLQSIRACRRACQDMCPRPGDPSSILGHADVNKLYSLLRFDNSLLRARCAALCALPRRLAHSHTARFHLRWFRVAGCRSGACISTMSIWFYALLGDASVTALQEYGNGRSKGAQAVRATPPVTAVSRALSETRERCAPQGRARVEFCPARNS